MREENNAKTISKNAVLKKLGNFVRVRNVESRNGSGKAPNQFEIEFENGRVFQSYDALCAVKFNNEKSWYFSEYYHDYSKTTSGYLTRYCCRNCTERRKLLRSGEAITIIE